MKAESGKKSADILVTGSEGFIGKHLCKRLDDLGLSFFRADITNGIDLTKTEDCKKIPPFKVAVHLAARTFVPDSWNDLYGFFYANINSTLNVLELCRNHKARMVFASSYVYGVPESLPISEEHPLSALNPYAHSKLSSESLCKGYALAADIPLMIFRPFNVFGPGQDERFLIPSILRQWKTGKVVLKDPAPRRDFVFVDDMVEAYIKALEMEFKGMEVLNIGSGNSYSIKEITETAASIFDEAPEIIFTGDVRKNEIPETRADIRKASQILNWKPGHDLKSGLEIMIRKEFEL